MRFQGLDLSLGIRKTHGSSGTLSHAALAQVARLQKGYTLFGKEVYSCDDQWFVLPVKINLGYVFQRPRLFLGDPEKVSKRY